MTHELEQREDGIVRLAFIGDMDKAAMTDYIKDFRPYLEATTKAEPMRLLVDASRDGKMSSAARHTFADLNRDVRLGRIAICHISRFGRVVATFAMKATGRANIRFFETEAEAVQWLNQA